MPPPLRRLRPHRDDAVIGVGGLLGGLVLWALGLHNSPALFGLPRWPALVALVAISGAELLRRTAPVAGLTVGTCAVVLDFLSGSLVATLLMFTDLIYAAVLYGSPAVARLVPRACALITVVGTVVPLAAFRKPEALLLGLALGLITVAPAWTGAIIRNHREAAESARLDAERTALLAEMDRREAVTAERARMARELHDMVANHLSAIAIHSTAALSLKDPRATDDALAVIRENSVQGLAEMRRLIGLLRDAASDSEPDAAPTLDGLDALLGRARANGATNGIRLTLRDRRPQDDPALPAPVEMAAYRIVQESVTNALKHAGSGEVLVELRREASGGALTVTVTSPLDDRPGPRAPGSGAGLVGMGERVELLGGEFEAGPADGPDAGRTKVWQVRAVLPVSEEGTS